MTDEITAEVEITETVEAQGTTLYPGTYRVRMPASYDPELVTGVDILCDGLIYIVTDQD